MSLASRRHAAGDVAAVQELFHSRGWSDGLPVVPPTADAVEACLDWVGMPGEQLIGVEILWLLRFPDGVLLAGSRNGRMHTVDLSRRPLRLDRFATQADDYLERHQLYSGVLLPSGDVALATFTGGTVVIDR